MAEAPLEVSTKGGQERPGKVAGEGRGEQEPGSKEGHSSAQEGQQYRWKKWVCAEEGSRAYAQT